ncbi:MAG: two-component sensor histidine kinase, partial [Acidobacteria bacterium]|nr:two-component sensor histidine kinase [Acidobacteriota bacterium]
LDLARFTESEGEGPLVAFLEARIKKYPVDLVVPVGSAGVQFAARHRERLFPDTPVLVLASDPRFIPPGFLLPNTTLVTQRVNLPGTVEDILEMQPNTTDIAVVFGASALERNWVDECRREFQPFANRVRFTWLNGLPLQQVLERCAVLPPHSFILHLLFVVDGDGVPCEQNEALRRLHQVANAPLFGYFASEFGMGPIGGRLYRNPYVGEQAARTAVRILRGESPGSIPPQVLEDATPVYDWRELQRWGISEARLPAGSVIQFRQPGFWELYRWPIIGAILIVLLQTVSIIGLLVNRAKRRQGEAEATLIADISSRFVNLPSGDVEHEILDAERRICKFLGLDLAALWQYSKEAPDFFTPTHVYTKEGLPAPGQLGFEHFPWYMQQMLANRIVGFSSPKDLPPEAAVDRESCRQLGIQSNLTIPLSVGGETPIGLLGFNTMQKKRAWPDPLIKRLQLVAQIFANALARKHADQVLRESEELNRATFEQAAVGIAHVGTDGRWLRINDKLCAIVGYQREELLELAFQDITHPEDLETDLDFVRQILSGERESYSMEKRCIRKDGSIVWVILNVSLVRTAAGSPLHFISVVEDITDQRRAETEAEELRANLAHAGRVTLLGQLASALAHELSQPLGAILRNAEAAEIILQESSPDLEELRAIVTDIRGDDQRAGQVIDRLRSLLKRRRVDPQPIELQSVVSEVFSLVRADAAARRLKLDYSPASVLPMVRGDRIHLQQVLLNLILNAMDAMDGHAESQPCIQVCAHRADFATIEVRVSDNGPGIPGESLERLFEPFFTTKANGMGMGLPVSKTLIEAHKGRIWAENGPEGGACFCFTLPIADLGGAP